MLKGVVYRGWELKALSLFLWGWFIKIFVGIPSNRDHSPHFVASLVAMVQHVTANGTAARKLESIKIRIKTNCSNIATARNDLVHEAIAGEFTHILFLDDDMTFPFDVLDGLCKYDAPVVAANCCQKKLPLTPTAIGLKGERVSSVGKTGYEQILRIGMAVALLDLSIFKDLPEPWFNFEWHSGRKKLIGEDYYFCMQLAKKNIPVIIDHDVSQFIGHVGAYSYGLAQ